MSAQISAVTDPSSAQAAAHCIHDLSCQSSKLRKALTALVDVIDRRSSTAAPLAKCQDCIAALTAALEVNDAEINRIDDLINRYCDDIYARFGLPAEVA